MSNIANNIKNYAKGFIDATLIGTIVILAVAFEAKRKENTQLQDRLDEQSQLMQRYGWPNSSKYESFRTKTREGTGSTSIPYVKN